MRPKVLPEHIAIIMDGNGRWAKEKGLARIAGHKEGAERVREIVTAAAELKVKVLTLFTFSTENWDRPKREIDMLMRYLGDFLDKEVSRMLKNNIRFRVIGQEKPLPEFILKKIKSTEEKTRHNTGLTLVLALNYGSRQEIVSAVQKFARAVLHGEVEPEDLDVSNFSNFLCTAGLPDPDLLIRTSGEMRISNFLLWQLSYAELYFPKKFWPDFKKADLEEAIDEYQKRERRYGRVNA